MNSIALTTGPGGLMALASVVPQTVLNAYFYSFTKAQSVARQANVDATSPAYFDAMTSALVPLGWTVTAGKTCVVDSGDAVRVPIGACASAMIHALAGTFPALQVDPDQVDGWITDACVALSNPPPDVAAQLDAWWSGMDVAVAARLMTVGPIIEVLSTPIIPAALISFEMTGSGWRSLITPSGSFRLRAQPVLMQLNLRSYARIEAALLAELDDALRNDIRTTQLDIDDPPTVEAFA